jgi:hypothetical protein
LIEDRDAGGARIETLTFRGSEKHRVIIWATRRSKQRIVRRRTGVRRDDSTSADESDRRSRRAEP